MRGIHWKRRLATAALAAASAAQAQVTVFETDFDATLPVAVSPGSAGLTGVEGFEGLGPAGNVFGGSFLRSATGNTVTLTLNGLPAHSHIHLGFLLAAIDSLDGTGEFPQGDFLHIRLDGQTIFRESFANALLSQVQSYAPPAGGELARHLELGFNSGFYYTDSAYNMAVEPSLQGIAHTASTATFTFQMEGPGIQTLDDESWAMDNLRVAVTPVPEPATAGMLLAGLLAVALARRQRR